jgi:hypothetical protein
MNNEKAIIEKPDIKRLSAPTEISGAQLYAKLLEIEEKLIKIEDKLNAPLIS